MTIKQVESEEEGCPAEGLLKLLSGKWKGQIFKKAMDKPIRFNSLLRELPQSNKQSLAIALRELEEEGLLQKATLRLKPLHIEYTLSAKGEAMIPIFQQLEILNQ
jgi:DNA-binding HxlR family transcriptional regulator